MMKCVLLLIIISLFFVGCNSDEPKLGAIGSISSNSTTLPFITNVSVPAAGTYVAGSVLNFDVTFSKSVSVTGIPRMSFVTDTGAVIAFYTSGTGTTTLRFSATLAVGVIDDSGITLSQSINPYGGSIVDSDSNNDAILTFSPPDTSGIFINAGDPVLLGITPPIGVTYTLGQTLRFVATFNARVCGFVTPKLKLNVGGSTKYATWLNEGLCGKTLKFDYVVGLNEVDSDGIDLLDTTINLTDVGSALRDGFGDPAVLTYVSAHYGTVKVNGVPPAPVQGTSTTPAAGVYKIGDVLTFAVNYDQVINVSGGTPHLALDFDGISKTASWDPTSNNTSSVVFKYTIVEGDVDPDGIVIGNISYNSSSFTGLAQVVTPSNSWSNAVIKVDGIRPVITSIGPPSNGLYFPPGGISATVTWSEAVSYIGGSATLKLQVDSDLTNKTMVSSGHTGIVTTFTYPIQAGDADFNGVVIPANAFTLTGGVVVKDLAGNAATVLTSALTTTGGKIVPDGVQHWYDPNNPASFGTSVGSSLTQLKDLIGTTNFSISDSPTWDGTPKRMNFASGSDYMTVGPFPTLNKLYIVMETKAVTPFQMVMATATPELFINFQAGKISTYTVCLDCAKYYDGDSWENTSAINGNFGSYANNTKYIIMLDYQGLTNVEMIFGSGFAGIIHEIFLVSGDPNPTTYTAEFLKALKAKHTGANLPPP